MAIDGVQTTHVDLRHPKLKRAAGWTAAVLLLMVFYVARAPIIWLVTWKYAPDLIPVVSFSYAPFNFYRDHPASPGSLWMSEYYDWCYNAARRFLR